MRVIALVILATLPAAADPRLSITHEPPPRNLRMRRAVAQAPTPPGPARPRTPMPTPPSPRAAPYVPGEDDQLAAIRDLDRKVSIRIDLGYQVEAANPSGKASLDARAPIVERDYAALRSYGFGEVYASTRGLGLSSLSSYFAIRFQAARQLSYEPPGATTHVPVAPPIATWFERSGTEARSGWIEFEDFAPRRWGLSRLRVRVGTMHVYGPWITHLDGTLIAYDGPLLQASTYAGIRHSDYTRLQSDKRPTVAGASLRFDLRGLPTPLPISVQGEVLAVGESSEAGQPSSQSALLQGDWRPRRDVAVIAQLRTLDGKSASQRLEVRTRYGEVTNLVFDLVRRTEDDWRWDPSLVAADSDASTARRYLDLGPVVPRFVGSLRAGTLIAENVDLYVRGAFAADVTGDPGDTQSSYAAPYVEFGGALEIRLRRAVALGASILTRTTDHPRAEPIVDQLGVVDALPAAAQRGEEGFTEAGTSAKLSLGARQFSSIVEFYGRRTRFAVLYVDPRLPVPTDELRFGGRVTLDAWIGRNLRLFAAYDASSSLELSPQITGYRSLRLMISGLY